MKHLRLYPNEPGQFLKESLYACLNEKSEKSREAPSFAPLSSLEIYRASPVNRIKIIAACLPVFLQPC